MTSNPPLIEIDQVTFFHSGREVAAEPALRGLSLRIEAGEFLALIGANGSGKTTLARHLNALLLPTRGNVRVLGMDTRERRNWPEIRKGGGKAGAVAWPQVVSPAAVSRRWRVRGSGPPTRAFSMPRCW